MNGRWREIWQRRIVPDVAAEATPVSLLTIPPAAVNKHARYLLVRCRSDNNPVNFFLQPHEPMVRLGWVRLGYGVVAQGNHRKVIRRNVNII